jgi:DNA-binding CsgD family transcriptional regulator
LEIANGNPTVYLEKLSQAIRIQSSASNSPSGSDHQPLTKRELDVLRRLSTKQPISKIAASMHISNNTIKTHLKNVYRKLNVESREEAVARGQELSLL